MESVKFFPNSEEVFLDEKLKYYFKQMQYGKILL